jgi:hypothetical protein
MPNQSCVQQGNQRFCTTYAQRKRIQSDPSLSYYSDDDGDICPVSFGMPMVSADIPSFLPPTKSIPSSIALSMNGLTAPVCSLICRAFAQRASETDCGSNLGNGVVEGDAGRDEGGVGSGLLEGGAKVARTSRISSSYCLSACALHRATWTS